MFTTLSEKTVKLLPMLLLVGLSACGPVKFSGSSTTSTEGAIPVTPATPTPGVSPTATPSNLRDVSYVSTVAASNNKLDIILVLDDSNSMLTDNQKLAAKLSNFVTTLQNNANLDWQACVTVTRALPVGGGNTAWGASLYWQTSATYSPNLGVVLKKGQANLPAIFANTINYIGAGWAGTDDERGIKAAYHHVYNGDYHYSNVSGCYRDGAAIAYIIISDEDERSIAGDASQKYYANELQPLEADDQPANFVSYVKNTFGNDKRFTVNSIIVKPGDTACMTAQDNAVDAQGKKSKSHYGTKYNELSYLTGGGIGSICDADFSTNLNLFIDKITDSLSSIPLECTPVGEVSVTITPTVGVISASVQGMNLVFDKPVPAGRNIDVQYKCNDNRVPSSVNKPVVKVSEDGFFARIVSFFKGLF
ncbi:hypothetical protein [Bdellovibrio svalbardensis]|uniref:VWFA domain-containing protein n=1 Tax=Bdellovibrio svalbardensis TaxID=2972972 RepID=A0ABT6DK93_9BACT|nr:hypothetical protein [Bdellovibrio svalbardensis]MDG0816932.1 hypothetical protein [Bdellovibrio svalbardensis]